MKSRIFVLVSLFALAVAASAAQELGRSSPAQTVEIFKNTGAIQCGRAGVPVEVMEKALTMNGIKVLSRSCGYDGYSVPTVCGAGTDLINVYEIETRFLQKAIDLGFGEISKLPEYKKTPCRNT